MSITIEPVIITTTTTQAVASSFDWSGILWLAIFIVVGILVYLIYKIFSNQKKINKAKNRIDELQKIKEEILAKDKKIDEEITKIKEAEEKKQLEEKQKSSSAPSTDLQINKVMSDFKDRDDEDYEKGVKASALEVTHAQEVGMKQLELQIEQEKRKRLVD